MQATVSARGLVMERTLSHISTKVGTGASTKLAARKVTEGRVRGMLVLAHMNTVPPSVGAVLCENHSNSQFNNEVSEQSLGKWWFSRGTLAFHQHRILM